MRRRRVADRALTAEELVQAVTEAEAVHGIGARDPAAASAHRALMRRVLAALGYDAVEYLRARHWLRRGKPRGYVWADHPRHPAEPVTEDGDLA